MHDTKSEIQTESANQETAAVIVTSSEADLTEEEPQTSDDIQKQSSPSQTDGRIDGNESETFEKTALSEEPEAVVTEEYSDEIKIKFNIRKAAIYSIMFISSAVFVISAVFGIFHMTKDLSRSELISKITQTLLSSVFGDTSVQEFPSQNNTQDTTVPPSDINPSETETADKTDPGTDPPNNSPDYSNIDLILTNETPYSPDMKEILSMPRVISKAENLYKRYGSDAPLVLLLHSHGTEGYSDSASEGYRTLDTSRNVVAIGRLIAEQLRDAGINVIHCETLFDAEDFTLAYYSASLEIKKTLAEYPSVSYIIDIHRDSIETPDGEYYAPTVSVNGLRSAQLMFVVGTDHGGAAHKNWRNNLALAARLHAGISYFYPNMMRNINLRSASFNEQYTDGSLLLEVGSCASTLEEAKRGAKIFANQLIEEIIG